jgi:hypothetical protein
LSLVLMRQFSLQLKKMLQRSLCSRPLVAPGYFPLKTGAALRVS